MHIINAHHRGTGQGRSYGNLYTCMRIINAHHHCSSCSYENFYTRRHALLGTISTVCLIQRAKLNYPQRACSAVCGVGYSPSLPRPLLYTPPRIIIPIFPESLIYRQTDQSHSCNDFFFSYCDDTSQMSGENGPGKVIQTYPVKGHILHKHNYTCICTICSTVNVSQFICSESLYAKVV